MRVPRATVHTATASTLGRLFRSKELYSGNQYWGNCQEIQKRATHRVQRGTNRPSGKMYRNTANKVKPRKFKKETGHCHMECSTLRAFVVSGKAAVPKIIKASETNRAIRPSGICQKMRIEIPQ